jgi:hypothetical protein
MAVQTVSPVLTNVFDPACTAAAKEPSIRDLLSSAGRSRLLAARFGDRSAARPRRSKVT